MVEYSESYYLIKDSYWLENQRVAGKILSSCIKECSDLVLPGKSTLEIDLFCESFIKDHNAIPAFKNYKGFPASICISINNEIVHGIPKRDKIIKKGDVVKIDSGVNYKGSIADKARTIIVGDCKNIKYKLLLEYVEKALLAAINCFSFDKKNYTRVGDIGYAINKEAKKINSNVVVNLGGHGLERNCLHAFPFVPNSGEKGKGAVIFPNSTLAIEPILTFGKTNIKLSEDGWTVILNDIGVHWEDTIFIHEDKVEIIT